MKTSDKYGLRQRLLLPLALVLLALSMVSSSAASSGTSTQTLPKACKLLTRSEAQTLAGVKLQPPIDAGTKCAYNGYPTGTVAQVFIYVDSSLPKTLQIDRKLGHKFWKVRGLGDQAWGEEWAIFVRKGKVWVTISLVRIEAWPPFKKRLERAAAIAISRVKPRKRQLAAFGSTTTVTKDPPASGGRERWRGKERRYGGSITQYAGVVYQPGVVVIGGGAGAVRARGLDGLTWTIAGNAPGAADLKVGKIMLATTFAAGRVLKLTRVGPDLRVVLGPVALTDVIRDGVFESTRPISLAKPLVYETKLPTKSPKKKKRTIQSRSAQSGKAAFSATPICCAGGVGAHIGYNNGSTGRLSVTVQLYVSRPSVDFRLRIGAGRLLEAGFELRGVAGLRYDIDGATKNSSGNVKSGPIAVPGSLTIPLAGPLAITLSQSFQVSMQLMGEARLKAHGDYAVTGRLAFGYSGAGPQAEDVGMKTQTPLIQNTLSLGAGVNTFSIGWAVRAAVGIGIAGFSAGVWYELKAGLAFVADGNLMSLNLGCVKAALEVNGNYGVGFTIPEFVRSVINAFLGVLRVAPIPASIGPSWGPFSVFRPEPAEYCQPRKALGHRTSHNRPET